MTDWQAVVGRYASMVWQIAYRLLDDYEDADDCVQETFLAALQVARRQRVESWPGLLACLSTRKALNRLHWRIRHAARHEKPVDWSAVSSGEFGPEENARAAELTGRLRKALPELPPQQAEVFCLRCFQNLSYREIARELDIPTGSVSRLLHRARARLHTLLDSVVSEDQKESSP